MAKKGTFGFKVSAASGNAAGFSNIPGASSYTATFGQQFVDAYKKGKKKAEKARGKSVGKATTETATTDTATETTPTPTKPTSGPKTKESGGRIGSFSVKTNTDGSEQVKTRTKNVKFEELKSGKYEGPIAPENIPGAYKPTGKAPSQKKWSAADKAALESERPKSYVSPTFTPEADTPETTARRRQELMEATAPKSRNAKTPKSSKPKEAPSDAPGTPRQFSTTDYSDRTDIIQTKHGPAVDLSKYV